LNELKDVRNALYDCINDLIDFKSAVSQKHPVKDDLVIPNPSSYVKVILS